jgi:hypothetical protein
MKKFSTVIEQKKREIESSNLLNERNLYLEFSKKYHKKHGVSGPFDKKFKGDKKKQEKYMEELGKAWSDHKDKKGITNKNKGKNFDFKNKMNESKADDLSSQMINDGGDPNYHFVTMSDDYYFEKNGEMEKYSKDVSSSPLKIKTTPDMGKYVFGPFMNLEESKLFAESIELDEINGPRMVFIQDRKNGDVYSRFLSCKLQPVWNEHVEGSSESADQEEYEEDPSTEYTYGDEQEDE